VIEGETNVDIVAQLENLALRQQLVPLTRTVTPLGPALKALLAS
jgi:hypothetical protein